MALYYCWNFSGRIPTSILRNVASVGYCTKTSLVSHFECGIAQILARQHGGSTLPQKEANISFTNHRLKAIFGVCLQVVSVMLPYYQLKPLLKQDLSFQHYNSYI